MSIFKNLFTAFGVFVAGGCGMTVMGWYQERFPVRIIHRYDLTKTVKPGDDLLIGLSVGRDKNCDMTVMRRVTYSDGSPTAITQEIPEEWGPLGLDEYILRIPINPSAPYGPGKVWSQSCARCNPLQALHRLLEVCSEQREDKFEVGPETIYTPYPKDFMPSHELAAQRRY